MQAQAAIIISESPAQALNPPSVPNSACLTHHNHDIDDVCKTTFIDVIVNIIVRVAISIILTISMTQ